MPQRETVPDEVVRRAEQIELVDMTPEALRRRMAHGNIYAPDKVDAALGNYFRVGNLTALRELALLWLADKVDEQLDRYRAEHGIDSTWETRERVVVALTGGPEGDTLIRRAARIAARTKGADLLAVHVARSDGLSRRRPREPRPAADARGEPRRHLPPGRRATTSPTRCSTSPAASTPPSWCWAQAGAAGWPRCFSPGVGVTTTAESGSIDVHLVTHEEVAHRRRPARDRGRALAGGAGSRASFSPSVGLPAADACALLRDQDPSRCPATSWRSCSWSWPSRWSAASPRRCSPPWPGSCCSTTTSPRRSTGSPSPSARTSSPCSCSSLVAAAVSTVVDLAARRTREAARARAEAETLSTLAGSVLRGCRPLPALLDQLRETFGLDGVTLLERRADARRPGLHAAGAWRVAASVGAQPASPGQGDAEVASTTTMSLVLRGHPLAAADRRVVEAFAAQAAVALRQERLAEQAAAAGTARRGRPAPHRAAQRRQP